jgi:hypothetical protein
VPSLTAVELELTDWLERQMLDWLGAGHADYVVNVADHPGIHDSVWRELARRAQTAGWSVEVAGTTLMVRRRT